MSPSSSKKSEPFDVSKQIWEQKYRYSGTTSGIPEDKSVESTLARVAKAAAAPEKNPSFWEKRFLEILHDFRFLPGGRIISNAGTARKTVTMFNCYVMNTIEDSIEGIFDTVKEAALTQKQGGGVGFDFSTLRPAGSHIKGCEASSSGPISFMQVLDSTCRTIMSAGQRRGAQMGVMRCDHPDIMDFITAKRKNASLQMFNLSVAITDKFMTALKKNEKWELVFNGEVRNTVHAVELWELIMKSTYEFAEPGVIFIDRVNRMNNLRYCEEIRATNPCGEQPLPPYGACLLGSINLTRFVKSPFTKNSSVDYSGIEKTARDATRLLDNVIEISGFPLEAQRLEAQKKRRMGLGITGLADAFIMLGVKYGSEDSAKIAEKIMHTITCAAYDASTGLAEEKGPFKLFDSDKFLKSEFVGNLPSGIRKSIKKRGMRNSHLTSIAPTGTISLLAGNISSGIEPVFALKYKRKIRNSGSKDGHIMADVCDYAYLKYTQIHGESKLPDYFITSDEIPPEQHLKIQAALQKHVDSSISKTINVPAEIPYEKFKDIYLGAYQMGLKGCTTFRPSEHITGVLLKTDDKNQKKNGTAIASQIHIPRPTELDGTTYKIKTPLSSEAIYLTVNDIIEEDGRRRPYELFINTKNLQHFSWIVAMTRLISAVFRRESDPSFLVDELKSIYDPNGGYFSEGRYIPSIAADIGFVIEKHLVKLGIMQGKDSTKNPTESSMAKPDEKKGKNKMAFCPQCNQPSLYSQENCLKCLSCGYSKCS
ncbi:MAG TPA: adenosylcobalamin-dependent ribonucleoside-diphosphate reductase [Victivallales bacterium]|nr:adenosylcobalamin-dependent ribonucleoside-diphosphate reductase [Victivallales bacterium]